MPQTAGFVDKIRTFGVSIYMMVSTFVIQNALKFDGHVLWPLPFSLKNELKLVEWNFWLIE